MRNLKCRRLFSLIIALLLFLTNSYVSANAESYEYQYSLRDDSTIEITGIKVSMFTSYIDELIIPDSIEGYPVTSIADEAFASISITSVKIPDSVIEIGINPFQSGLSTIALSPSHPVFALIDGVLFRKADKRLICYPSRKIDEAYAIPQGIEIIGAKSFCFANNLKDISIPNTVVSIEDFAFSYCQEIKSILIPSSVSNIGINPFLYCEELVELNVDSSNQYFWSYDNVLFDRKDQSLICFPYALSSYSSLITHYRSKQLKSYEIPYGIETIKANAFAGCDGFEEIIIPNTVDQIEEYAFYRCSNLEQLVLPDTVRQIDQYAFYGCDDLQTITFGSDLLYIGDYAFYGCEKVSDLIFPNNLNFIGDYAFSNGPIGLYIGLQTVYIPDSVIYIGTQAFGGWNHLIITVENGSFAAEYCEKNNLSYTFPNSLDWLGATNIEGSTEKNEIDRGAWLSELDCEKKDFNIQINRETSSRAANGSELKHYIDSLGPGEISYQLKGQYKYLTGLWTLDENWEEAIAEQGALEIYCDGEIKYLSPDLGGENNRFDDVVLDISACQELKIVFNGYHYYHYGFRTFGNIGRFSSIRLTNEIDASLQHRIEEINSRITAIQNIPLSERIENLPVYKECQYYDDWYSITDSYGNKYSDGYFDLCSYHENGHDPHQAYAIIRTNREWQYFRGTYFAREGQSSDYRILFQIYADDMLVYDSGLISRETYPIDFDVEINFAENIRIQSYSDDYTFMGTNPGIILVNAEVHN